MILKQNSLNRWKDELAKRLALQIKQRANQNLDEAEINDTGFLKGSAIIEGSNAKYTIEWKAPYAASIEFGLKPGTDVPIPPIKKWARRKLGIKNERENWKAAYNIVRKINREGTEPKSFIRNAIDSLSSNT